MFPILIAVGGLGLVAQVMIIRELFAVFSGNEVASGVFLSLWLVCEGLGAWVCGRFLFRWRNRTENFFVGLAVLSVLSSVLAVLGVVFSRRILGVLPGESLSLLPLTGLTLLVTFLPAATHGGLFVFGAELVSYLDRRTGVVRAYLFEGLGTVLAALTLYFFLLSRISGLAVVALLGGILLVTIGVVLEQRLLRLLLLFLGALFLAFVPGPADRLERLVWERVWHGQRVLQVLDSPYGRVVTLERDGQRTVLYDGVVVMNVPVTDIGGMEEMIHLPMLLAAGAERVLVLGQGFGGLVREILRHPVAAVAVVELDPVLVAELRRAGGRLVTEEMADQRVRLVVDDPRRFLKETKDSFDLMILPGPAPASLAANRLFSEEFFSLCRKKLRHSGMLVTRVPGSPENLQPDARAILQTRQQSLRRVFPDIMVLGLDFPLILAGERVPGVDITMLARRLRGVGSVVLDSAYLVSLLDPFRQERFLRVNLVGDGGGVVRNSDLVPGEIFLNMVREHRRSSPGFARFYSFLPRVLRRLFIPLLVVLVIVGVGGGLVRGGGFCRGLGIFTSGFAGAGISVLAIFIYQTVLGSVYSGVALLLAGFMFGTVPGAALGGMLRPSLWQRGVNRAFLFGAGDLILVVLAGALCLFAISGGPGAVFVLVLVLAGAVLGWQFSLASQAGTVSAPGRAGRVAGELSVLDFTGGAVGGMVFAVFVLPLFGIGGAVLFIILVKLISFSTQVAGAISGIY